MPFLLTDFFCHLHGRSALKVFLCGKKPEGESFDPRRQMKYIMERRMGCSPFLGEDIERLRKPVLDKDHLTIEVDEAEKSDLVVMFLGSPGTFAEVTAFAMTPHINPKLVVFNQAKFKQEKTFINLGPLRLLKKDQVLFYENEEDLLSAEVLRHVDSIVAATWFRKGGMSAALGLELTFEEFVVFATIYAAYPLRLVELKSLLAGYEIRLNDLLRSLFDKGVLDKREKKYVPCSPLSSVSEDGDLVKDISRVRASMLDHRLRTEDSVADYRLIL